MGGPPLRISDRDPGRRPSHAPERPDAAIRKEALKMGMQTHDIDDMIFGDEQEARASER